MVIQADMTYCTYLLRNTCHENHNPLAGLSNKTQQLSVLQTYCSPFEAA